MSRLFCYDEKKAPEGKKEEQWIISDAEIKQVIREATAEEEKDKKPTTKDLHGRIEDLEFELECLRADSEEEKKRKKALLKLLEVIDVGRIEARNQPYVRAIVKRIKQLVS